MGSLKSAELGDVRQALANASTASLLAVFAGTLAIRVPLGYINL
jgi:hypothetical protein